MIPEWIELRKKPSLERPHFELGVQDCGCSGGHEAEKLFRKVGGDPGEWLEMVKETSNLPFSVAG